MDQPWGLSGPEFTALYVVGFLAAVLIVFAVQAALSVMGARAADVRLDTYQAAYVAGGSARVVDTAIAALALRGQILVARSGRLTAAVGARVSDRIEAAVHGALRPTASRSAVVRGLRGNPDIDAVGDSVRAQGLLLSDARVLLWRLVVILPAVVWVVGLVRAVNGANLNRPIGNLTTLLWITGFVTLLLALTRLRARHRPSAGGRAAVRQLRRQYSTAPVADPGLQVAGVAVLGFAALTDSGLRAALVTSTGSGGDGSGGGDGGGGCGGGGCGG